MNENTDPTPRQIAAVCMSIKVDYGVMSDPDRAKLNAECVDWWRAIVKELRDPSNHFVVNTLCGPLPGVPEGWKLVPVEPTSEMQDAMLVAFYKREKHFIVPELWGAMLAAAPERRS